MPSTDIKTAQATSSGSLVSNACRVRGVYVRAAGTAGTLVLKDGGSSGTTKLTINTPAAVSAHYHDIPGDGIAFGADCYGALTTADGVTIYYTIP